MGAKLLLHLLIALLSVLSCAPSWADGEWVSQFNVRWDSQSQNSSASMPLVGGNMGCNVWVENDELLFYFSSPGCRDENGALLKFGRVRINTQPNIFAGAQFEQELDLRKGCVTVKTESDAMGKALIRMWVEIKRPVLHIDFESDTEIQVGAIYESWRTKPLLLPEHRDGKKFMPHYERSIGYSNLPGYEGEAYIYEDALKPTEDAIQFYHRMRNDKCVFYKQIEQQELTAIKDQLYDPLTDLTFGGKLFGDTLNFVKEVEGKYGQNQFKGWQYKTGKSKQARLKIVTHIAQTKTLAEWENQLEAVAQASADDRAAREAVQLWWEAFWTRSRIIVNAGKGEADPGWEIGRNYNLFRYMLVSGFFANEPTMFNGGVLTFDPAYEGESKYGAENNSKSTKNYSGNPQVGPGFTPDFRRWGAALTAQNQRLVYWPMLKNGDFDGILPHLNWYKDILPSTQGVARHYYGIDGCLNAEQPNITGLIGMSEYGWTNKYTEDSNKYRPANFEPGIPANGIGRIFQSQLENPWMMLEYYHYTGNDISEYLPFIEQAVIFYDEYYRMWQKKITGSELDGKKLLFYPSNALEGHRNAINPTSVIAGLSTVLQGLLDLPDELQGSEKKKRWQSILTALPDYPIGLRDGKPYLKPAANKEINHKTHCPELYPLYPYQIFGLGMKDLELIKKTLDVAVQKYSRYNKASGGWSQNLIYYARVGDAETARILTIDKIEDGPFRFPAFFPGGDYAPDHNVGGSGMIGLQEMLMQTHNGKIRVLPAWPADWDVEFRLHAPGKTVVECVFEDGVIKALDVTPGTRKTDVITPSEDQRK